MPLQIVCDHEECEENIRGERAFRLEEGEIEIEHEAAHPVGDVEFRGHFCSVEHLVIEVRPDLIDTDTVEKEACPYCGDRYAHLGRHEPYCDENPDGEQYSAECQSCGREFSSINALAEHDCGGGEDDVHEDVDDDGEQPSEDDNPDDEESNTVEKVNDAFESDGTPDVEEPEDPDVKTGTIDSREEASEQADEQYGPPEKEPPEPGDEGVPIGRAAQAEDYDVLVCESCEEDGDEFEAGEDRPAIDHARDTGHRPNWRIEG